MYNEKIFSEGDISQGYILKQILDDVGLMAPEDFDRVKQSYIEHWDECMARLDQMEVTLQHIKYEELEDYYFEWYYEDPDEE